MTAWQYLFLVALQAAILGVVIHLYRGVRALYEDMQRRQKRRRKEKPAP